MRRPRVILLGAAAPSVFALACAVFGGCSSDEAAPSSVPVVTDAGTIDEVSLPETAPPPPAGYDGGVGIGLVDVADTPCATRGGSLAVVLPNDDAGAPPSFIALEKVGDRLVASAEDGSGFLLLDADGKNGKRVMTAPLSASGAGATVVGPQIVFGGRTDPKRAVARAYDASGAASAASVVLANEYPDTVGPLGIGADDSAALLVWTTKTGVRARGFSGGAGAGAGAYDLALTSNVYEATIAVSSVKAGLFAVVFSGNDTGSRYQTAFGRGSATARIGDPSNLFTGAVPRKVVGLARTSSGFAVLVTVEDGVNPYAMLVLTDLGGRPTSAGLKLVGTASARAIAVNGAEIGVLAERREGDAFQSKRALAFRAFDASGAPLAPWVCAEPPGDASVIGGGLVAQSNGYAAIYHTADGTTSLARFDRLGTGPR